MTAVFLECRVGAKETRKEKRELYGRVEYWIAAKRAADERNRDLEQEVELLTIERDRLRGEVGKMFGLIEPKTKKERKRLK